ncbi:helix-turn-helix domain-containing protein [Winogradskya humida]
MPSTARTTPASHIPAWRTPQGIRKIRHLYNGERQPIRQIAVVFGCSYGSIHRAMEKNSITRRRRGGAYPTTASTPPLPNQQR